MNSKENIARINEEITRLEEKRKISALVVFFEDVQRVLYLSDKDTISLAGDIHQALFVIIDPSEPEEEHPLFTKFIQFGIDADQHNDYEIRETLKTDYLVINKDMTPKEFINKYAQDKYAKIYLKENLTQTLFDKPPAKSLKI